MSLILKQTKALRITRCSRHVNETNVPLKKKNIYLGGEGKGRRKERKIKQAMLSVEVIGEHAQISFLFPEFEFWWAWQQVPLSAEPSGWPWNVF